MDSSALAQFIEITGASETEAQNYLKASNNDVQTAVETYYASITSNSESGENHNNQAAPAHSSTNPFSSASASSRAHPRKKFGSLRDLQSSDSTEGDDSDDKDQEYFAGGDKSGLAVQDPSNSDRPLSANEHVQRLLHTARQNRPRPPTGGGGSGGGGGGGEDADEDEQTPRLNNFRGAGVTLGGEGAQSRVIPDPSAPAPSQQRSTQSTQMVERTLHLWDDGFSVDDGPLYRYDDPRNARTLEMINRGSAPLDLMNVETGQAVDVKLEHHRGEKYVRPKKKYRPFEGTGNRLGSPTPGVAASTASTAVGPASASAPAQTTNAAPETDPSKPIVRLQIRLQDGTRLPAQFNPDATMATVYDFVVRASPVLGNTPFVLATTFPTKDLTDKKAAIREVEALKRGGVVVVKLI